jgi:hypothetical protein
MSQAALSESFDPTIPLPAPEPTVVVEEVGSIGMLLKSPKSYARLVAEDRVDLQPSLMLAATSLGFYAVYGLAMGCFAGGNSLWQGAIKVPLVLFGTLALSAPCLYLLLCLVGLAVSGRQVAAMLAGVAGLSSAVLVGFAPLAWLFGMSTGSVRFMALFHVAVWCSAFACGGRLLLEILCDGRRERNGAIAWAVITLIVCAQSTTFWRPMLGVTLTKDFREHDRAFFFQHFCSTIVGASSPVEPVVPQIPAAAPSLPTDPSNIPPPTVIPMSN